MSPPESAGPKTVGYEKRDADPRRILIAGLFLAVTTFASVWVSGKLDATFRADRPSADPHPLTPAEPALPPEPRLQMQPTSDVTKLRRAEAELLSSYGWVDAGADLVRIPVEVAIEQALAAGFPVRDGPKEAGR